MKLFKREERREIVTKMGKAIEEVNINSDDIVYNSFMFIGLNNGAGMKTVAVQIASLLTEAKKKVCIVDTNLIQPGVSFMLRTEIKRDNSLMQYMSSRAEVLDVVVESQMNKNLFIVSASPIDDIRDTIGQRPNMVGVQYKNHSDLIKSIDMSTFELLEYLKSTFDYLIFASPYQPFNSLFIQALSLTDKGFIVIDEQTDNRVYVKMLLSYINAISNKENVVNNIILNKSTEMSIAHASYAQMKCRFIASLPFEAGVEKSKNQGQLYYEQEPSREYNAGLVDIIKEIQRGLLGIRNGR